MTRWLWCWLAHRPRWREQTEYVRYEGGDPDGIFTTHRAVRLIYCRACDGVRWAEWVEATGGDPPSKAAELVLELMSEAAAGINGQFLWIANGLKAPLPSWS